LNARGAKNRHCDNGAWGAFGNCADPDVCIDGVSNTEACGINGHGTQLRSCVSGQWSEYASCIDSDICLNGATETRACGLNNHGTQTHNCVSGQWETFRTCIDWDTCIDGTTESIACGKNRRGALTRSCVSGQWGDYASCVDPDVCFDNTHETKACGINGHGTQLRSCVSGQWSEYTSCVDSDICLDGATETRACGLNGRGLETRTCLSGVIWGTWNCIDSDVCVDSKIQYGTCGYNGNGRHNRTCVNGAWNDWTSCMDPDQCVIGTSHIEDCSGLAGSTRNVTCPYGKTVYEDCTLPPGPCAGDVLITDNASYHLYAKCTSIEGALRIVPSSNNILKTLTFPFLGSVGGTIELGYYLTNVTFSTLTQVGGSLTATDSYYLASVTAPQLVTIGGSLNVSGGYRDLTTIAGFPSLTSVGGNLSLYDNEYLSTFDFPSLVTVGGDLSVGEFAKASGNRLVTNLDGFRALTTIGGSLILTGNGELTDIDGLSGVTSVGKDLIIRYNMKLTDLSALAAIRTVPGNLMVGHICGPTIYYFSYGDEIAQTSLLGLQNITSVGGNVTIGNVELTSLDELNSLKHIGGTLELEGLGSFFNELHEPPSLETLGGLHVYEVYSSTALTNIDFAISEVTGNIDIEDQYQLTHVSFPTLENLGGRLSITEMDGYVASPTNPSTIKFPELRNVGSIDLRDLGAIETLSAFPKLETVTNALNVGSCSALVDFEQLKTVGGNLTILGWALEHLDAFGALTTVGGTLSFTGNDEGYGYGNTYLTNPHAFESLVSAKKLTVGGFPAIPGCWAQNLALQIWPDGNANTYFWNLPVCKL
jgi:hypothetical protein